MKRKNGVFFCMENHVSQVKKKHNQYVLQSQYLSIGN